MVEVEWDDSADLPGWGKANLKIKPVRCRTAGYLLRETKNYVVVAPTVSCDGGTISPLAIPKGCITARRQLTTRRRKGK